MAEELAYCVKCREKTKMTNISSVTLKDGRPALKGECSRCGLGVYKILTSLSAGDWFRQVK